LARCRSWLRVRAALRAGRLIELPVPVRALITPGAEEPGIVGFLRPVLVLPAQLMEHLNPRQLGAILTHELCHVRRRDNFFAAIHMLVEAIFWFNPLVWWVGSRMVEERELACDEEVLRMGCEPTDYVEGILKVCRFYTESPLPCISGVTGSDVKKRLRAILTGSIADELNAGKKVVLATIGLAALAVPIVVGVMNTPIVRAQSQPPAVDRVVPAVPTKSSLEFEVATLRRAAPQQGDILVFGPRGGPGTSDPFRKTFTYLTLRSLLMLAYDMKTDQISGPSWIDTERYDIVANVPQGATKEQVDQMLQNLLTDRFKLTIHRETKDVPLFELVVGKGGPKFKERPENPALVTPVDNAAAALPPPGPPKIGKDGFPELPPLTTGNWMMVANGRLRLVVRNEPLATLVNMVGNQSGRPIVDKTGLIGKYNFSLEYAFVAGAIGPMGLPMPSPQPGTQVGGAGPANSLDSQAETAPALVSALQEQLGLRLESKKGPIEVLIIDHAERIPIEN
jgi:bla regulator protein BlaR1